MDVPTVSKPSPRKNMQWTLHINLHDVNLDPGSYAYFPVALLPKWRRTGPGSQLTPHLSRCSISKELKVIGQDWPQATLLPRGWLLRFSFSSPTCNCGNYQQPQEIWKHRVENGGNAKSNWTKTKCQGATNISPHLTTSHHSTMSNLFALQLFASLFDGTLTCRPPRPQTQDSSP